MRISSRGFSIMELIVSLGLTAIVAVGMVQMTGMFTAATMQSDARLGRLKLLNDMRSVLLRRDSCLANMKDRVFSPSQTTDISLRLESGQLISAAAGENEPADYGLRILKFNMSQKTHVMTSGSDLYYSAVLQVEALNLKEPNTPFRALPLSTIIFKVGSDGRIADCMVGETASDSTELLCQAMGGKLQGGQCALSAQRVEISCGEGQYLKGFNSEGVPECVQVPRDPADTNRCSKTAISLGAGFPAPLRGFGVYSCDISCIGTYGPFSKCGTACSGYGGFLTCGQCIREGIQCN